jgi:phosphotriesterase-related protein
LIQRILFSHHKETFMRHLITTLGPKRADELGVILPHEHVFVDLRTWDQPGYAQAEAADVIALMAPEIAKAAAVGVTALVECSTVGVGRRADILRAVSEATDFPLVAPTGIYREPWVPEWAHAAGEEELYEWMLGELEGQIEQSGVQAGFIKLSAGDDGLTACETKILRAAARAATATGAAVGSHTIRGRVARDQLNIIEACGYTAERFIWIHASAEPDITLNMEMARRGAWIEYDWIGSADTDADDLERILRMLDAGLGDHLLLSHDRGWYDPAQPGGGTPRPFTYISESFLPTLRRAGLDEATIRKLTCANPFRAFAR